MKTKNQESILNGIKERLNTCLPANATAILYGSQARGDFREDSDWDILIIIDKDRVSIAENSDITYPLIMYGWIEGIEINPIVYTSKEWNTYKDTPFYDNVIQDGLKIAG